MRLKIILIAFIFFSLSSCEKEKERFTIQGTLVEKDSKTPMARATLEVLGWRYKPGNGYENTIIEFIETDESGAFTFFYEREIKGDSVFDHGSRKTTIEIQLDTSKQKFHVDLPWNIDINRTFETNY